MSNMRYWLLLLFFLPLTSIGQKLQDPLLYGRKENRMLSLVLQGMPTDTVQIPRVPEDLTVYPWVAVLDGQIYVYNTTDKRWEPYSSNTGGSGPGGTIGANSYTDYISLDTSGIFTLDRFQLGTLTANFYPALDARYVSRPELTDSLDAILPFVVSGDFFTGEGTDAIPLTMRGDLWPPAAIEYTASATISSLHLIGSSRYDVNLVRGALPQTNTNKGDGFYYTKVQGQEVIFFYPSLVAGETIIMSFNNPNLSTPITAQ